MRVPKYILLVMSFVWIACSDQQEDSIVPQRSVEAAIDVSCPPATRAGGSSDSPLSVAVGSEGGATRTELCDDWTSIRWGGDDRIAVWARDASGSYTLSGTVFSLLRYITADEARFTTDIVPMAEGSYDYVALYPVPAQTSGTRVSYNLPSVQDGTYRAEWDIMASQAVRAGSLTTQGTNLDMTLSHKLHAMRIKVPADRNYRGRPVTRLIVEFPTEVTGQISFDVANPTAAVEVSNGSRIVDVRLSGALGDAAQEREAWIFVAPNEIAGGVISFTAVYDDGYCAETLSTQTLNRTLAAGHVTPVTLSASATEQPLSWLDFNIDHSKLGEPVETLTVTAPAGVLFADGSSTAALKASSGHYSVSYYAILSRKALEGTTVELGYDSANAVLSGRTTLPSSLPSARNEVRVATPWLYFEDFSGITTAVEHNSEYIGSDAKNPESKMLDEYGLTGWSGNRVGLSAGVGLRVMSRVEVGMGFPARYNGRVDSAPIGGRLKSGHTVKVRVRYGYAGDRYNAVGGHKGNPLVTFGYTTETGAIGLDGNLTAVFNEKQINIDVGDNNDKDKTYYGMLAHEEDQVVPSCTTTTRLSWKLSNNRGSAFAANGVYWLYLDNIRVSITQ